MANQATPRSQWDSSIKPSLCNGARLGQARLGFGRCKQFSGDLQPKAETGRQVLGFKLQIINSCPYPPLSFLLILCLFVAAAFLTRALQQEA